MPASRLRHFLGFLEDENPKQPQHPIWITLANKQFLPNVRSFNYNSQPKQKSTNLSQNLVYEGLWLQAPTPLAIPRDAIQRNARNS
jgi:hypothetical protein